MSTISVNRPPPTPSQVDTLHILVSKAHYAHLTRPPLDSPLRAAWDVLFLRDVIPLLNLLNTASFKTVPTLAMGCVWAANLRLREVPRPDTLNIEAIQPVVDGHPARDNVLPKGMHRLKYQGQDSGPMGLLPEAALPDRWWTVYAQAVPPVQPMQELREFADGTDETGNDAIQPSSALAVSDVGEDSFMSVDEGEYVLVVNPHGVLIGDHTRGTASPYEDTMPAILATLTKIPSETIPDAWIGHPAPCARCTAAGLQCYIHPLSSSVCAYCARRKQKCSLTFSTSSRQMSGFLAWAYWKVLSYPAVFGQPTFDPDSFSADRGPPISEPPAWFQNQFGKDRPESTKLDEVPVMDPGTPSARQSASRASSASRPSTRSSKAKEVAPSASSSAAISSATMSAITTRASRRRTGKPTIPTPTDDAASAASSARQSSAKARGKQRAMSISPTDVEEEPRVNTDAEGRQGSSMDPIDVDAMDIGGRVPSKVLRGRPIETGHLARANVVRGSQIKELSRSPARQPESSEEREVTVPRVQDSWRRIPRLDDVLTKLTEADSDHREEEHLGNDLPPATLATLRDVADDGKTALPETELLKSNLSAVTMIMECTKQWAETLTKQSISVWERSGRAASDALGRSQGEVLGVWAEESQAIGEDVDRLCRQLADTNQWVSILALCLKDLMAAPVQGETLEEILREVARLKYAYEDSVKKFSALQEDVRPLWRHLYRLRGRMDTTETLAEVAANDAARAVEPLLANLYSQLSAEMDAIRITVSRPLESLATSIAQHGGLTPALLQELIGAIRDALAEIWRTTASIGRFVDGAWARCSAVLSARVKDVEARVVRLEGVCGATSEGSASTTGKPPSIPQLAAAIDSLSARVDALQVQMADSDAMDRRVRDSLAHMGLTDEVLARLLLR